MKWISVTTRAQEKIYELWSSKERVLAVTYHPGFGTLRLIADGEKRIFSIGREGFLRRRTVLRNEYGIRIGQLANDNNQDNQGTIDIYEEGFTYTLQRYPGPTATISRNTGILDVTELPVMEDIQSDNYDLLMLILCWYISTTVKKQLEQYA